MPTHQSDIIQAKDSLNISEKSIDGAKTGATVLHATAVYTVKGGEVDGDIIELTDLPVGATVIPQQSFVAFGYPAGFSYGSVMLEDEKAAQEYGLGIISMNAPEQRAVFGYSPSEGTRVPKPYDEQRRLVARFYGTPSGKLTGGKIVFGISYTIKG